MQVVNANGALDYSEVYFQGHKDADTLATFVQLFLMAADSIPNVVRRGYAKASCDCLYCR